MSNVPDLGVYQGVSFERYREWDAVNNSSLGPLLLSPAHYRAAGVSQQKETPAQRFGSLFHVAIEDRALSQYYAVLPDLTVGIDAKLPKGTKEYRRRLTEFEDSVGDKVIVTQEEWDRLNHMIHAVWKNQKAASWLREGDKEVCLVWDDEPTGLRCKARVDHMTPGAGCLVDIKTTDRVVEFEKSIGRWRYHRQAAFYLDGARACGLSPLQFAIVAVEKMEPYAVRAAPLGSESVDAGRSEYKECLRTLADCRHTGRWPGPEDPEYWSAPAWVMAPTEVELIIDGEKVKL